MSISNIPTILSVLVTLLISLIIKIKNKNNKMNNILNDINVNEKQKRKYMISKSKSLTIFINFSIS